MEILDQFGIDKYLLAAQIINFLIISYVLKRYAYKPILKLLQERKHTIEEGLRQADEAKKLLEQANEKQDVILRQAQVQAKKMQDEIKKQGEQMMKRAEEDAKKKASQMLTEAKEKIEEETKAAEKRLEAHTTQLAMAFLEKAVSGLFSPAQQKEVLQKATRQMKGIKK